MRRWLLLIGVSLVSAIPFHAQTTQAYLSGSVTDSITGMAIPGASISCLSLNSGVAIPGRTAISASQRGPVLLRREGELIAAGADGLTLAGPDGPVARARGELAVFPGDPGYHRLLDADGATLALTL